MRNTSSDQTVACRPGEPLPISQLDDSFLLNPRIQFVNSIIRGVASGSNFRSCRTVPRSLKPETGAINFRLLQFVKCSSRSLTEAAFCAHFHSSTNLTCKKFSSRKLTHKLRRRERIRRINFVDTFSAFLVSFLLRAVHNFLANLLNP